ncbi:cadherin-like domain-containing protein, partial [Methylobacterium soli]|uniref:cadherin-like domain-containing protein n=1 Tax=Methylobacterium soli TaxID=553447 RepID=UPI001EE218B9
MAAIDSSHFAVVWCDYSGSTPQQYGAIYTVTGSTVTAGAVRQISASPLSDNGSAASVASLPNGNLVVAWTQYASDFTSAQVVARTFDPGLNPLSAEVQVSETAQPSPTGVQVATQGNNVVVAWSQNQLDSKVHTLAYEFSVNNDGTVPALAPNDKDISVGSSLRDVAFLANGDVLVVYNGDGPTSGGLDASDTLSAKIYGPGLSGSPSAFAVSANVGNTGTSTAQAVAFANGGFGVYWAQGTSGDPQNLDLYHRVYDNDYVATSAPLLVHPTTPNDDERSPQASVDENGNVIVLWEPNSNTLYGIYLANQDPDMVVNVAPTAENDTLTVDEDSGVTIVDVLANDSSAPDTGETLTVTTVTQPASGGSVTLTGGVVRFTPGTDFNGTTSFGYTVSDGNGGTDTATVNVTVNAVNDAPTLSLSQTSDTLAENADTSARMKLADITVLDADSGTNTVALTGESSDRFEIYDGALYLKAGASLDFETAQSLSVTVSVDDATINGTTPEDSETFTLTVTDANDVPVTTGLTSTLTLNEDGPATALFTTPPTVSDGDSEGLDVTLTLADPSAGRLTGPGLSAPGIPGVYYLSGSPAGTAALLAAVRFEAAANFNGETSVQVVVSDRDSTVSQPSGTVSITVNAVNDAPTATNLTQPLTVQEDAAATPLFTDAPTIVDIDSAVVTATLTLADTAAGSLTGAGVDVNGAYTITGAPAAVAAALANVSFLAEANYSGSTSVAVAIDDSQNGPQGTNPTGTISVTVNAVNDAPTLSLSQNSDTLAENADTSARMKLADITVLDADSGTNTVALTGESSDRFEIYDGALYLKAGASLDFETDQSLTVTVSVDDATINGTTPEDSKTFTLTLTDVNDAPTATSNLTQTVT